MPPRRGRSTGAASLHWIAILVLTAGGVMLAWSAFVVGEAHIVQWRARRTLERELTGRGAATASDVVAAELPPVEPSPILLTTLLTGSPIAELSIPRIHLSTVVLQGSDDRTLMHAPGHLESTALPGHEGNVVIAGHRDTFFRPLRHIKKGDEIVLHTPQARFQYRVTSLRVVHPQDLSVLEPTDESVLTLITCYPFWVLGPAPDRFVVRAVGVFGPAL